MKKEALEVLYNRRAIRKFKPEQIKDEELDAVLKAGMYAPSAMGMQSPLIVAVQNKEDVLKINELSSKASGRPGTPYYGAPTIIIIFGTTRTPVEYLTVLDSSAACTNMLNAAYAAGLGSVWINCPRNVFESEEGKALLKKWGVNEIVFSVASIALGYPDQEHPTPKPRRDGQVKKIS
ncbi:MAG: nitroreductase [Bacilli bacterium]|nr:nitroreductase [Bacilli bacterium]